MGYISLSKKRSLGYIYYGYTIISSLLVQRYIIPTIYEKIEGGIV